MDSFDSIAYTQLKFIKNIHSEECQQSLSAVIFHAAFVCQLFHKNTIGRHTGILILWETARLSQGLLAGRTQGAAASTDNESRDTFGAKTLHQANLRCIMGCFGGLNKGEVRIVGDFPDALKHQSLLVCKHPLRHRFGTAAIRGTGVVSAILSTQIFFTVRTEGRVKYNIRCIYNCGIGKAFFQCIANDPFFRHSIPPYIRKPLWLFQHTYYEYQPVHRDPE